MKTLLLIAALLLTVIVATAGNYPQPSRQLEYKIESGVDAKKLNSLANERWEVIATGNYGGQLAAPYVILKRHKEN